MANILVCVEDSDATRDAGNYYSRAFDPGLTLLGHQSKLTTCEYAKDVLESEQPDVLLFLISRKQSSCWQVASSVRS